MAALTGLVTLSKNDLLQVSNSNSGIDGTLRTVSDGEGTSAAFQLSTAGVKFTGTVAYGSYSVAFGGNFTTSAAFFVTGALTIAGAFTTAAAFTQAGAFATTITSTAITNSTLPSGTHTLVGLDTTDILTNKTLASPTLTTPVLGTPSSGNLSNCTAYPIASVANLGTGVATFLATPSSANLASACTDETGSGALVFGTTPTLATPVINGTITGTTVIPVANGGTGLTVCNPHVQRVSTQTGTVATGTTTIPLDNTIPQNTEGDQYMSLAITPKNSANILEIHVTVILSTSNTAAVLTGALFQDSTANALAASNTNADAGGQRRTLHFIHTMAAGTTSATTFKVRAGANGAGTTTFNGQGGTQEYGGVMASSIVIHEYTA